MTAPDVVVVGAGLAGLSCATALADAGATVRVLDKGRGIGGRMATRRVSLNGMDVTFDHGAQYLTARDAAFRQVLSDLGESSALWEDGAQEDHHVGAPTMSALPRALAAGLDIRQSTEVCSLQRTEHGWLLGCTDGSQLDAACLVLTIPAPQAAALLGPAHPVSARLATVTMSPCLTLMAAFSADTARPFISRRDAAQALAWIACDSSKPGRSEGAQTWVAQASPEWSAQHLELSAEEITARMLPLLCAEIGAQPEAALYAKAHRWRYAQVTHGLGQPFEHADDGSLWLGGDWCLAPRAEAAWQSGRAIAQAILARR